LGIPALADNSANAQFTFDDLTIDLILGVIFKEISDRRTLKVLCLGTPSIHKALLDKGHETTLLDEDDRLTDILPSSHRFNMYNGNWYETSAASIGDSFTVIVMDPPFHPKLLPALFRTVAEIFPNSFSSGLLLFAFPYFNEKDVVTACSRLQMSDMRLTYRNHKKYVTGETSPVRLYMSCEPVWGDFEHLNHKFCDKCKKIVHASNFHCENCSACTTTAGKRPYKHCVMCDKCVKPDAVHCSSCKRCFISNHTCT
jgi:hypothetical protein